MMMKRIAPKSLCALMIVLGCSVLILSAGCSGGPSKPDDMPALTPCTITVTHNGSPVEGASVLLSPKSGKFSAAGTTDASGKAVMKTNGMYDGVAAGEFLVTVTKLEDTGYVAPPEPEDPKEWEKWEEQLKNQPQPKNLLPEKYASFGTSELTLTVSEGSPVEQTLELTD